jgi:hypothetical protein
VIDDPAFHAKGYPTPPGLRRGAVRPEAALVHEQPSEVIRPYEAVRNADAPDALLLIFPWTTYEAAASAAKWDRAAARVRARDPRPRS